MHCFSIIKKLLYIYFDKTCLSPARLFIFITFTTIFYIKKRTIVTKNALTFAYLIYISFLTAAPMNPLNNGCDLVGRDLNSG